MFEQYDDLLTGDDVIEKNFHLTTMKRQALMLPVFLSCTLIQEKELYLK